MMSKMRSAEVMTTLLLAEPAVQKLLRSDEDKGAAETAIRTAVLRAQASAAFLSDRLVYRIAVSVLGVLALTAAGGAVVFGLEAKTIPEALVSLGSAAAGALVGLFANPPTST